MRRLLTVCFLPAALMAAATGAESQTIRVEQAVGGERIQMPMPGRELKTGTGRILGRVYALDTGQPIRRAQVRISGPDIMPKAALTDAEGHYEFRDLPAGRFTLQASKAGYVSVQYGQTRPYESGRPIDLAEGQVIENGHIAMPRGSVIAGRIVDEYGDPMPDVQVIALRQSWSNGQRRLVPAGGRIPTTNDLGQFRIYGLPPGEYYVSATLRGSAMEVMALDMLSVRLGPGAAGAGPSASTPTSGYAPTYFPGTANPSEAQKVSVIAGQEHHGVDFALLSVRLARVSGVILGSNGQPLSGAMVNLVPSNRSYVTLRAGINAARTDQNGAFTINSVPPGDYILQANAVQIFTQEDGANRMVFAIRSGPGAGGERESGYLPVLVAGEDVSNLVLTTARGGRVTGRVVYESGGPPPDGGRLRILASPVDADGPAGFGSSFGLVDENGAFELDGVSGRQLVRPASLPSGWMLKEVRLNGQDITDAGAEFRPGESVGGLEVVLTNRTTSITGAATALDGSPVKDYTVVIFADDENLWRMPRSRWVTGTRPDQEGRFKIENLPPGSYHAVAVEYIPQGEWGDPDLLARLKNRGERFRLDEGGTQVLDLKIVGVY